MAEPWRISSYVICLLLFGLPYICKARTSPPRTILVLLDGFRWDYIQNKNLTTLSHFAKEGVRAESLESGFITKTYPNLITLVTGLYAENHGIVDNKMYDPLYKEFSTYTSEDPKWYQDFEPIWITNENCDKCHGRKSAVIQYGASNVKFGGKLPWYYDVYNKTFTTKQGFNKIIELLDARRGPNLIVAYFEEVDKMGHMYGPQSPQLKQSLQTIDRGFGRLMEDLKRRNLTDKVNVVVTSDHGMTHVDTDNFVFLSDILRSSLYFATSIGAVTSIWPKQGEERHVYQALKLAEHIDTYKREEIPKHFRYRNHRRIPPILVVAHRGWTIITDRISKRYPGHHGYYNTWKDMHGIFMARGPSFARDTVIPTFSNIHVYSILCKTLGITPKPNNGSLLEVKAVFGNSSNTPIASCWLVLVLCCLLQIVR